MQLGRKENMPASASVASAPPPAWTAAPAAPF